VSHVSFCQRENVVPARTLEADARKHKKKKRKPKTDKKKEKEDAAEAAKNKAAGDDDTDIGEKEKNDNEKNARTVFVGNVPVQTTQKQLRKVFEGCGKIKSARFRSIPVAGGKVADHGNQNLMRKACFINKQFLEGIEVCNAYVEFGVKAHADAALALNGKELNGNHLRVDRLGGGHDSKLSVFLGNLPFAVTNEEVGALLSVSQ
jgi:nucleolar protein 12